MVRHDRIDLPAGATVVVLCALWGLQQVAVKLALAGGLAPAMQGTMRSVVAAALLCLWVAAREGRPGIGRLLSVDASWRHGLLLAALFGVEFLLLFSGLARTTASRAVLFLYTAPFYVAIGAHLLIPGERLGRRQVLGLGCAFLGVVAAVADGLRGGAGSVAGDALMVGAALLWATLTVLVKASPTLQAIAPTKVLLYQLAGSAPILLAGAVALGEPAPAPSPLAWAMLFYQCTVVAFASYLTWYWLIARYPAGRLAAFSFLTPLFGMAAATLLLGEPASAGLVAALVLVAGGLFLVNAPPKRPASARL